MPREHIEPADRPLRIVVIGEGSVADTVARSLCRQDREVTRLDDSPEFMEIDGNELAARIDIDEGRSVYAELVVLCEGDDLDGSDESRICRLPSHPVEQRTIATNALETALVQEDSVPSAIERYRHCHNPPSDSD